MHVHVLHRIAFCMYVLFSEHTDSSLLHEAENTAFCHDITTVYLLSQAWDIATVVNGHVPSEMSLMGFPDNDYCVIHIRS